MFSVFIPIGGCICFITGLILSKHLYQKECKRRKPKTQIMKHYHILYELPGKPVKLYYGMDGYLTTEHDKAKTFINLENASIAQSMLKPDIFRDTTIIDETHEITMEN